ncbi:glycosyltransferase family 4 protein [Thermincola ferriacetica]
MRILIFSWEYPPKSVGGLAQHVYYLSKALAKWGHQVYVVTCGGPDTEPVENIDGVQVHRVHSYAVSAPDFRTWILHLNLSMLEYAVTLLNSIDGVDVVHAHDWLVAYAGRAVKHAYRIPLVATIHATEYGRNHGLHNDNQRYISDVEWWLTYEAWRVICCSSYMEQELKNFFQLPGDKIRIIPNGVEPEDFQAPASIREERGKMIFFIGRLVREKGVQVLLEAAPRILSQYPDTRIVIAGKGPYEDYLRAIAHGLGLNGKVEFAGYVNDMQRNRLYQQATVAAFPSLYEPFGIVALEAMAAKTPVVVGDTGGLREIVEHGVDGLKCYPGSAQSLADNILAVFNDPGLAQRLKKAGYEKVIKKYSWDAIAGQTAEVYKEIVNEAKSVNWQTDTWMARKRLSLVQEKFRNFGRYNIFGQERR